MMNERRVADYMPESSKGFLSSLLNKVQVSQDLILQCGMVAGIAFLVGFLLKKFSSYVAVLVALGLALVLLSHFGVINIMFDWSKAQSFMGIDLGKFSQGNCLEKMGELVRSNIFASVAAVIGFLIGLRLG